MLIRFWSKSVKGQGHSEVKHSIFNNHHRRSEVNVRQEGESLPDSNHTCSHDATLRIPKHAPRFEGFPTRAHVLCPSVTCAVRSANRTLRTPESQRRGNHRRARSDSFDLRLRKADVVEITDALVRQENPCLCPQRCPSIRIPPLLAQRWRRFRNEGEAMFVVWVCWRLWR